LPGQIDGVKLRDVAPVASDLDTAIVTRLDDALEQMARLRMAYERRRTLPMRMTCTLVERAPARRSGTVLRRALCFSG
jgi:hypothetical protein